MAYTKEVSRLRQEELTQVVELNSRLAGYIDKIRQEQMKNKHLKRKFQCLNEAKIKEESKSEEVCKQSIEKLTNKKHDIEESVNRIIEVLKDAYLENDDLKEKLKSVSHFIKVNTDIETDLDTNISRIKKQISNEERSQKTLVELFDKSNQDKLQLERKLVDTEEKADAIDREYQNLITSFTNSGDDQNKEMTEVRTKKHSHVDQIIDNFKERYDNKTSDIVRELHKEMDKKYNEEMDMFSKTFTDKLVTSVGDYLDKDTDVTKNEEEIQHNSIRFENLFKTMKERQIENKHLGEKLKQLQKKNAVSNEAFIKEIHKKDTDIEEIFKKLSDEAKTYEELLEQKSGLDMEIAMYRELVHCEESRLGIQPGPTKHNSDQKHSEEHQINFSFLEETKKEGRKV